MTRNALISTILLGCAGLYIVVRLANGGMGYGFAQRSGEEWVTADASDAAAGIAEFSPSRTVGIWVAAMMTLCIFSFLYGDNPFYKFAEAIVVGVSAAYWMVVGFWTTIVPNLLGKLFPGWIQSWAMPGISPVRQSEDWLYIVPLILGIMLLMRLSPKGNWIARWPLALIIGATAGLRLIGFIQADFLNQVRISIVPLVVIGEEIQWGPTIANVVMLLSVLSCLVYFFFSIEHKGVVGKVARVGIWVLMITFGAAFGFTVMGRIALLAIRFEFLFDDWLWLIDPLNHRVGW
ncbi:hypothetical protein [Thalassoroseus pseudoceratinae]|uniref:hypothetical protein n=1 Tax=Thalassoroseus pseudoceratinae TaxID=2713176 RepID=UPI0014227C99|nr:hypothetical protein [Thalassoroseus pseudoceratinae]